MTLPAPAFLPTPPTSPDDTPDYLRRLNVALQTAFSQLAVWTSVQIEQLTAADLGYVAPPTSWAFATSIPVTIQAALDHVAEWITAHPGAATGRWLSGVGTPGALGQVEGDFYFEIDTGRVDFYHAGAWVIVGALPTDSGEWP